MAAPIKSLQREALQLVFWQLIVTAVLSVIILFIAGFQKGLSTFLGGSAYIIPQFFFAGLVFSYAKLRLTDQFMIYFFIGELLKLIISAILFILFVNYFLTNVVFTMTGYIIAITSFWFVCGWHFGRTKSLKERISP